MIRSPHAVYRERARCAAPSRGCPPTQPSSGSMIAELAPRRERDAHRGIVALTLLAPVGGAALFFAEALNHASEGFRLDALIAPLRAPLLELGARRVEILDVLAHRLAQAV